MDTTKYLQRLSVEYNETASLKYLSELHRRHLYTIPFENLDIHNNAPIELDVNKLYDKIINRNRGGFCYELNGLFNELLKELGFKTYFVSCNVFSPDKNDFGPDFDHIAMIGEIDGDEYLIDVGFGENFIEPLKLIFDVPQNEYGVTYILEKLNDDEIVLKKSKDGNEYLNEYKFKLAPRDFNEFEGMCHFQQTSTESHFTKKKICSIAKPNGRVSLSDNKFIITDNGQRTETDVKDENDFNKKLFEIFQIKL